MLLASVQPSNYPTQNQSNSNSRVSVDVVLVIKSGFRSPSKEGFFER